MKYLPEVDDKRLLVGHESRDDAGVYLINSTLAMVQSIDVFGPVVDDPFAYGQIAAANSLSDLYAMGVAPSTAVAFAAFPSDSAIPDSILGDILRGGADKVAEAGALLIGGHSIRDKEPKYGLCVTGFAHPSQVITNAGCRPGDQLVLTKPIGSGILTAALKRGELDASAINRVTEVMSSLNKIASEVAVEVGVNAMTDVTGFGLLGHLGELSKASKVHAEIAVNRVPTIAGVTSVIESGVPGGTRRNLKQVDMFTEFAEGVTEQERLLLADAQTSGGLLISVPESKVEGLLFTMAKRGLTEASLVGTVGELVDGKPLIHVSSSR